ncbi:hypothetical protein A3D77_03050 [Candidatus Gottesmanbacteria bacterium RIFCSPHIGHO2_02_FULL_39_11]|uniref:GIY-YIG domain-containing protein n=1 Tax=Candidatus Gottesmanbacteria bacterium RIFCSPHIGHO2_02_FULL_39_11 TaxID=1798382 RepID=A0A1F5ZMN8_9BACT|nr:MAG: hypothetical protein A3D77_03050 [Candidatus Gottesmanbacteria bacterium RIFCSPHIGHO2_02_FULL_39_11]
MTGFNYYVYILTNKRNTVLYIGITNNLSRRIEEHLLVSTNDFVRKYNLIKLIYVETFTDPLTAITREKEIKGWTRKKKEELINKTNPEWNDLIKSI